MPDKAPCEYCGEMITLQTGPRTMHVNSCKKKAEAAQTEEVIPQMSITDIELQRDVERATKIEARRRKEAPGIMASPELAPDAMSEIVRHLRNRGVLSKEQEKVSVNTKTGDDVLDFKEHAFWGDETKHKLYVGQGYVPVVEDGVHVRYGDVKLYKIARIIPAAGIAQSQRESTMRLTAEVAQGKAEQEKLTAGMGTTG